MSVGTIEDPDLWSKSELIKAVEIVTAIAWWMGENLPETPMPDWAQLPIPICRTDALECWRLWQIELNKPSI